MKRIYQLKVLNIEEQTNLAKAITLEVPTSLQQYFDFNAGQYVIIKHTDSLGNSFNRCYSISSKPSEKDIVIGVKKVQGGKVSSFLVDTLKVGDILEVSSPEGNFLIKPALFRNQDYVFVAGGSGITPIKSMIGYLLDNEPFAKVYLIYGNQDEDSIIFDSYFEELETKTQFKLINCLNKPKREWKGETGLLTMEKIMYIFNNLPILLKKSQVYVCGPSPMMKGCLEAMRQLGIPKKQVFTEYFTAAAVESIRDRVGISSDVKIITNEKQYEFTLNPNETILQGALRNNIALSYSCQSGLCSTCGLRLKTGAVNMGVIHGLTDKQLSEGYILTCQAIPTTDKVVLDARMAMSDVIKREGSRLNAMMIGLALSVMILIGANLPNNEQFLALGKMNTGHEDLACEDCHTKAKGTVWQQLNANIKYYCGLRKSEVDFGLQNVDNKKCESCHERPNDRHPTHRFQEPRFYDAREAIHPEKCESCHLEHNGVRIVLEELNYCQHCHQDTKLRHDPLDVPHVDLVKNNQWNTCLQCHDFHGNHVMEVAAQMKDTIPMEKLLIYAKGGEDPFGKEKKYLAEEEKKAIQKMLKQK